MISGGDEAEGGDEHGEGEEEANGAIKGTENEEDPADAFGEGGKKAPELGEEIDAEELHFGAENFPHFGPGGQLGKTMGDKGGAEADANEEEACVAIFSEEFKEHCEWIRGRRGWGRGLKKAGEVESCEKGQGEEEGIESALGDALDDPAS